MQPINHQAIRRHMNSYNAVEQFTAGKYTLKLYALYEKGFGMDYQYDLIAYLNEEPVVAIGYEMGASSINFLGVTLADGHINLGIAPDVMDLLTFRTWALQNIGRYLEGADLQAIADKMEDPAVKEDAVSAYTGNTKQAKMSPLDLQTKKRIEPFLSNLREFKDVVEFCYVKNFETRYKEDQIRLVPLHTVYLVIACESAELELVAIIFEKKKHSVESILEWLLKKSIVFAKAAEIEALIAGKKVIETIEIEGYKAACLQLEVSESPLA